MRWLIRLERHFDWLAFPGLFKYLTFLGVIVWALQWVNPQIGDLLDFDRERILHGEVWRLFTYLVASNTGGFSAFGVIMLFFLVQLSFLISDSLEAAWGPTPLTLYILVFWVVNTAVLFVMPFAMPYSGASLYSSLFFAFATLFPTVQFMIMLLLPVQVRWLAWIAFAVIVLSVIRNPILLPFVLPTFVPYALWVLPDFIHNRKSLVRAAVRRQKFNASQMSDHEAFHCCAVCGRTEKNSPDLEFRVTPDGKEYCQEHLPS